MHPSRHRGLHAGAGGALAHVPAGSAPRRDRRWSSRYGARVRSSAGWKAARSGAAPLGCFACLLPREDVSSQPCSWGWRRCDSAFPLLPCLCQKHSDCQHRGWLGWLLPAQGSVTAENWAWGRAGGGQRQGPAWGAAPSLPPQPLCVGPAAGLQVTPPSVTSQEHGPRSSAAAGSPCTSAPVRRPSRH